MKSAKLKFEVNSQEKFVNTCYYPTIGTVSICRG